MEYIVTAVPSLNVRRAPSLDAPIIARLPSGARVNVTPTLYGDGEWRRLADREGYVSGRYLLPSNEPLLRYVIAGRLRIRQSPSLSAPIIGTLAYGTAVCVCPGDSEWAPLLDRPGYVKRSYLSAVPPERTRVGVNIDLDNPNGAPAPEEVRPLAFVRFPYAAHQRDVRARLSFYSEKVCRF
ncbi:MAG: hypothetical protein KatS3mg038_1051 [Candidatus Kapaibacterium sp.]|nr:MAG: hypothetical protein KatS3mg038_1051 [Candidatus Kapabacteria bacterium]